MPPKPAIAFDHPREADALIFEREVKTTASPETVNTKSEKTFAGRSRPTPSREPVGFGGLHQTFSKEHQRKCGHFRGPRRAYRSGFPLAGRPL
jgi:hypothetical protein